MLICHFCFAFTAFFLFYDETSNNRTSNDKTSNNKMSKTQNFKRQKI